jgi:hypothetical protein
MVRVMNTRMFLALFLLGFATNAPAIFEDELPPTPDEAHGFLGGTFQRYAVAYAGNNGRAAAPRHTAATAASPNSLPAARSAP